MSKRKQYFVLVLVACLILSDYSISNFSKKNYPLLPDYFGNPAAFNGTKAILYGQVISVEGDNFQFKSDNYVIPVRYDRRVSPARFGTTSVFGYFSNNGFVAITVQNLEYDNLKYVTSLIGLFIVVWLIWKEWKIGIPLREKNA